MGDPKISNFVIALVWISFITIVLISFISGLSVNYNKSWDSTTLNYTNKLEQLDIESETIKDSTTFQEKEQGFADIVGTYLSSGYKAIKTSLGSFEIFVSMVDETFKSSNFVSPLGNALKSTLIVAMIISLFIGVVISAIMRYRI